MSNRDLNFAGPHPRLRILQAGVVAALSACGFMVWAILGGTLPNNALSAVIGEQSVEATPEPSPSPTPIPSPFVLTDEPAHGVAVVSGHIVRAAEEETGRVLLLDVLAAASTVESDRRIPDYLETFWLGATPNRIVLTDKAGEPQFRPLLPDGSLGEPFEPGTSSIAVNPDGTMIAMVVREPLQTLIRLKRSGEGDATTLLETRMTDPAIRWADRDTLSVVSKRPDRDGWDLSLLSTTGTLTPLLTNKPALEVAWSPDGARALVSYAVQDTVRLAVLDVATGTLQELNIGTSARKCAWLPGGASIVCGVPNAQALSRDAAADRTATNDAIALIEIATGITTTVRPALDGTRISIIDPVMTASGRFFVFRNLYDRKLYGIPVQ